MADDKDELRAFYNSSLDTRISKEVAAKRAGMSIERFDEFLFTVQD